MSKGEPKRKQGKEQKAKSPDEVSGNRDGVESLKEGGSRKEEPERESGEAGRDAREVHSSAGTKETEAERRNARLETRAWDERHEGG